MELAVRPGATTGIGSVPESDVGAAVELSFGACPDLPFVPQLAGDDRSGQMVAQALVGVRGVELSDRGALIVDPVRIDPLAKIVPDLEHPTHACLRAFLDVARVERPAAVKWQSTGPLTLAMALIRHGIPARAAFDVGVRAVRATTREIHRTIEAALPGVEQIVLIDEPSTSAVLCPGFPVPPEAAIDIVSGALAGVELAAAAVGVHCCADADMMALVAAGPNLLSFPVRPEVTSYAGQLSSFLDHGGWIAWGVVPTDRPLGSVDRYWRELQSIWGELEQLGCDSVRLRRQSLLTPVCGLGFHTPDQARSIFAMCNDLSARIESDAAAAVGPTH
jgi:hypothetical protein